jgi:hypothetical protein
MKRSRKRMEAKGCEQGREGPEEQVGEGEKREEEERAEKNHTLKKC